MEPRSPALQADSLPAEPPVKPLGPAAKRDSTTRANVVDGLAPVLIMTARYTSAKTIRKL